MLGFGGGVVLQNDVEARDDVLVYTSAPLQQSIEVTGPVTAILYVSTSTTTADFTAKLVDVHPDGRAFNVSDGILRRKYAAAADPAAAGPTPIEISLWPTSTVFAGGHRIALEVAASNFPRFDRNTNTDVPIATATRTVVSTQAVHHQPRAASRLVMPVIPSNR